MADPQSVLQYDCDINDDWWIHADTLRTRAPFSWYACHWYARAVYEWLHMIRHIGRTHSSVSFPLEYPCALACAALDSIAYRRIFHNGHIYEFFLSITKEEIEDDYSFMAKVVDCLERDLKVLKIEETRGKRRREKEVNSYSRGWWTRLMCCCSCDSSVKLFPQYSQTRPPSLWPIVCKWIFSALIDVNFSPQRLHACLMIGSFSWVFICAKYCWFLDIESPHVSHTCGYCFEWYWRLWTTRSSIVVP